MNPTARLPVGRCRNTRCVVAAVTMVIVLGITTGSSSVLADSPPPDSSAQVPAWLRGVWTREWIQTGKVRTSTLDVHYLQTPSYFADIRIPKGRAGVANAKSFADLTDAQLRALAGQNGFTGLTTLSGAVATWNHDIQFQPSDGSADRGRLQRIAAGRLREHGLDESYIEAWKSIRADGGRFLVIRLEKAGRLEKTLLVAGDLFIYVRNRGVDLPQAESFEALIDSRKPSRAQIEAYLDCEFSVGRVQGGAVSWEIQRSTLPWREGGRLDFVAEIVPTGASDGAGAGAGPAPRSAGDGQWSVPVNTFGAGEIRAMFGGQ